MHEVIPSDPKVTKCHSADGESLQLWYERLEHQSKSHIKSFLKGLGYDVIVIEEFCDGCQFGKHYRSSFGTRSVLPQKPGDIIHSNVCGSMETELLGGKRFFVVFKNDFAKFRTVYFIKEKSEVVEKLKLFIAEVQTLGHVIKVIMTKNGTEYCNSEVLTLLGEYRIRYQTSMPYVPE